MEVNLKQESVRITDSFTQMIASLEHRKEERMQMYNTALAAYHEAATHGDLRENAAFTEAIKDMTTYNAEVNVLTERVEKAKLYSAAHYQPIGMIVMYSTVHFRCMTTGEDYIFKIYPEGVSDLERNIIARDSRIGQALWLKEVGDEVKVPHRVSGEMFVYKILDIY